MGEYYRRTYSRTPHPSFFVLFLLLFVFFFSASTRTALRPFKIAKRQLYRHLCLQWLWKARVREFLSFCMYVCSCSYIVACDSQQISTEEHCWRLNKTKTREVMTQMRREGGTDTHGDQGSDISFCLLVCFFFCLTNMLSHLPSSCKKKKKRKCSLLTKQSFACAFEICSFWGLRCFSI